MNYAMVVHNSPIHSIHSNILVTPLYKLKNIFGQFKGKYEVTNQNQLKIGQKFII